MPEENISLAEKCAPTFQPLSPSFYGHLLKMTVLTSKYKTSAVSRGNTGGGDIMRGKGWWWYRRETGRGWRNTRMCLEADGPWWCRCLLSPEADCISSPRDSIRIKCCGQIPWIQNKISQGQIWALTGGLTASYWPLHLRFLSGKMEMIILVPPLGLVKISKFMFSARNKQHLENSAQQIMAKMTMTTMATTTTTATRLLWVHLEKWA